MLQLVLSLLENPWPYLRLHLPLKFFLTSFYLGKIYISYYSLFFQVTNWISKESSCELFFEKIYKKIYHVDSFVVLFLWFFVYMWSFQFRQTVFHQINLMNYKTSNFFEKWSNWFSGTKMFQILLYTLSNLFDSTNLIKFIWPCTLKWISKYM